MLHIPSEFSSSLVSNTDEMPIISGLVVVIASSIFFCDVIQSITNNVRGINDAIFGNLGDLHQPKPVTNHKQYLYPFHKDMCICLPISSTHPTVQGMLPVDNISHLNMAFFSNIPWDHSLEMQ
jgi:hypothetical protein